MSKKNHNPWKSQNSARPAVNPAVAAAAATPAAPEAAPIPQPVQSSVTPAQLLANKANALLSTGPRTAAGLAKSSLNAVKNALTGRTVLLPSDDAAEYAAFVEGYFRDLKPVGTVECELVQNIADSFWRGRRIRALEFAIYAHGHAQFKDDFNDYPEEIRPHMIALQTDMVYEKQIRNYHRHEARLDRQRYKDMAELHRLKMERLKGNSQPELPEFLPEEDDEPLSPELQAMVDRSNAIRDEFRKNGFVLSFSGV